MKSILILCALLGYPQLHKLPARTETCEVKSIPIIDSDKNRSFQVNMKELCCNQTTESGADEVYILIIGQCSDGTQYFARTPAKDFHWDMNDGNQPTDNPTGDSHCITNKILFSGNIKSGQTWWLNIVVAEEDGGTSKEYQEHASEVLISTGNPYAAAAGIILEALTSLGFYSDDSDDWIGMFGVKISYTDAEDVEIKEDLMYLTYGIGYGTYGLKPEWTSKESVTDIGNNSSKFQRTFSMNHDGSDYSGKFEIK